MSVLCMAFKINLFLQDPPQYIYFIENEGGGPSGFKEVIYDARNFSKICSLPSGTMGLSSSQENFDYENDLKQVIVAGGHVVNGDYWLVVGGRGITRGHLEESCVLEDAISGFTLYWGNGPAPSDRRKKAFIPSTLESLDLGPYASSYEGLENVCGIKKNDTNFYQVLQYPNGTKVDLGYTSFLSFGPKEGYTFPLQNSFGLLHPEEYQGSIKFFDGSINKLAPFPGGITSYGLLKVPVPDVCLQSQIIA